MRGVKTGASEQSSARAKAVGLLWGQEWLSVWENERRVVCVVRLYPHLGRATLLCCVKAVAVVEMFYRID